ncbi:uncharacterized protein TNCV_4257131 [Trichonephila clavipes]|nr:uncharacterized protein TNCV_4257131 [Trichonephila clavipes]
MYLYGPLTSESYMEILSGSLDDFLEDEVSLRDLSRVWYQHDGAPAHKFGQPCTFLAQTFDTPIMSYGDQQEWPSRSHDLSHLNFFLPGFLKAKCKNVNPRVNTIYSIELAWYASL